MTYGEWVLQERKRKHLTQVELAKKASMTPTGIGLIERGICIPRKKNQLRITAALNAAPDRIEVPAYAQRATPGAEERRKTNGDAVRAMSDEELVFMIHCQKFECFISKTDRDCYQCKLTWLKQEAKGENDATETGIPVQACCDEQ